ncbi:hypothetical protein AAFC00_005104 [Neodothiora populina]|uniref:aminodeoxychorismate synthase n=1 Tax=Neodothiora populina TaxID=2781224 RepID=A0ABR3PK19_9PEZI
MHPPRLLFLDAYDSFSNNIIVLLQEQLNATVETIHIDDERFATDDDAHFHTFLKGFDGVVAGPGPGDPRNPDHLGLIGRLWHVPDAICLPVLGICLGFQSLALAFGGSAERLVEPRHGLITELTHCDNGIFRGVGSVDATQYHSLHVRLDGSKLARTRDQLWQPTESCPKLAPLAWDLSDQRNGPVLMALKHSDKPFWGVQYHPESICTNAAGASVIKNWWFEALAWSFQQAAAKAVAFGPPISASHAFDTDSSDCSESEGHDSSSRSSLDITSGFTLPTAHSTPVATRDSSRVRQERRSEKRTVAWRSIGTEGSEVSATVLLSALQDVQGRIILLESGTKHGVPVRPETGRFSILACLDGTPLSITYSTSRGTITSTLPGTTSEVSGSIEDVWTTIDNFMDSNRAVDGPEVLPFWGGLVGFVSYEAGLQTIDVQPSPVSERHPDVWFIQVERSVVIDHVEDKIFIQTIRDHDHDWVRHTVSVIDHSIHSVALPTNNGDAFISKDSAREQQHESLQESMVSTPARDVYSHKIDTCQSGIRAGDSYELCLTDQTTVTFAQGAQPTAWELYGRLRNMNPAPFGAYMRFKGGETHEDITILSSSPERFLSWSRTGKCQFRPIKGTVLKTDDMTREKAESILNSDKEQAENLMIVDLIRHDLHGVVGPGNVRVEKLMQVEEYETVYQLVSVIEGQLPSTSRSFNASGEKNNKARTGLDVLAASLPPGSMTGAPKKRSCEILRDIEGSARSLYSGVIGYFDVGGGGDFSVVIRTAFQWSDEKKWRLGAGGAVTTLSTADGEYEEMMAKRASSLRAFLPE